MILTVQKHDKFGKVWVLCGVLRHLGGSPLTYFEDTNTVVDELKISPEGTKIVAVHVKTPGFEECRSLYADRTVTQREYQCEALFAQNTLHDLTHRSSGSATLSTELIREPRT